MSKQEKTPRIPKLWEALLTMGLLIVIMAVAILVYGVDPHVPMFLGTVIAALMALRLGYKWEIIEKAMMDGIYRALQSVIILAIIGILIGFYSSVFDAGSLWAMWRDSAVNAKKKAAAK